MIKRTLIVVDGIVVSVNPETDDHYILALMGEPLYMVLEKSARWGWKTEGDVPSIFETGKRYVITVAKESTVSEAQ
jgi:hypothetical protein